MKMENRKEKDEAALTLQFSIKRVSTSESKTRQDRAASDMSRFFNSLQVTTSSLRLAPTDKKKT